MIPANELRIGNHVLYEGAMFFVDGVTDSRVHLYGVKYGTDDGWYLLSDVEGVRITPEILGQCGFEQRWEGYQELSSGLYLVSSLPEWCLTDVDTENAIARATYLHQLQNLFFAIIGTELFVEIPANETATT